MIDIDLPSLQEIDLGKYALEGKKDESNSLIMQGTHDISWMIGFRPSSS